MSAKTVFFATTMQFQGYSMLKKSEIRNSVNVRQMRTDLLLTAIY